MAIANHTNNWALYCNDLAFARTYVINKLREDKVAPHIGHKAISLGLDHHLENKLNQDGAFNEQIKNQFRFRLARKNKVSNPYNQLVPKKLLEITQQSIHSSRAIVINLNGGIGDHLEALNLLIHWSTLANKQLVLNVSNNRFHQLRRLLECWPNVRLSKTMNGIPIMAIRSSLAEMNKLFYKGWIELDYDNNLEKEGLICCWKAEGSGDAFSAHCRSIPFKNVIHFYKELRHKIGKDFPIYDITNWRGWEKEIISNMSISNLDPSSSDLKELAYFVQRKQVITIDTALAHLCASMNKKANVLLPLFHDERWFELHNKNNNYYNLELIKNQEFCNWKILLKKLLMDI